MQYRIIQPPAHLAGYVRFYWSLESGGDLVTPYVYRSMADGCAELLFHYKSEFADAAANGGVKSPLSLIHGQSRHFRRFVTNSQFGIFGAYLYPFAITKFFSMPASELSDKMPALDELLGGDAGELEDKIMNAACNNERAAILTAFLERRLFLNEIKHTNIFAAINMAIMKRGQVGVGALSGYACMSERQFERKFKEYAGFNPKLFCRILRFQHAADQYAEKELTLTGIAYKCGYYDQSHFIHEFREFSGYHPKHYFSGKAEGIEYRGT